MIAADSKGKQKFYNIARFAFFTEFVRKRVKELTTARCFDIMIIQPGGGRGAPPRADKKKAGEK